MESTQHHLQRMPLEEPGGGGGSCLAVLLWVPVSQGGALRMQVSAAMCRGARAGVSVHMVGLASQASVLSTLLCSPSPPPSPPSSPPSPPPPSSTSCSTAFGPRSRLAALPHHPGWEVACAFPRRSRALLQRTEVGIRHSRAGQQMVQEPTPPPPLYPIPPQPSKRDEAHWTWAPRPLGTCGRTPITHPAGTHTLPVRTPCRYARHVTHRM